MKIVFDYLKKKLARGRREAPMNPDDTVEKLRRVSVDRVPFVSGHLHVHVSGFRDHILIFWDGQGRARLAAKGPDFSEGKCVSLEQTPFRRFPREDLLRDLGDRIVRIRLHKEGVDLSWTSISDFSDWLDAAVPGPPIPPPKKLKRIAD